MYALNHCYYYRLIANTSNAGNASNTSNTDDTQRSSHYLFRYQTILFFTSLHRLCRSTYSIVLAHVMTSTALSTHFHIQTTLPQTFMRFNTISILYCPLYAMYGIDVCHDCDSEPGIRSNHHSRVITELEPYLIVRAFLYIRLNSSANSKIFN